ncbi:DUF998 domain-containing protein [Glaciihabitans sp. UYNi722]|uniref:DUF998 domain-containing protein n=1 Tax=Glaciihabitans sp. UYNi722 TaxID=3156344 RepID=UPI003393C3C5
MRPTPTAGIRRVFATTAMAIVLLYLGIDVVLQLLPPHYSVVSDAESDLAVGPYGWAMAVNFFARAVMSGCVIVVVSLSAPASALRRLGAVLLAVAGLCSAALVFAPTDVNPTGEFGMTPHTTIGFVHVVFATTGFVVVLAAMTVLTVWFRTVSRRRAPAVFLVVALAGLLALALSLAILPQIVGITERICLAGILGWAFALSAVLRNPQRSEG